MQNFWVNINEPDKSNNRKKYTKFLRQHQPYNAPDKVGSKNIDLADIMYQARCKMLHEYSDLDSRKVKHHITLSWNWKHYGQFGWNLGALIHPDKSLEFSAFDIMGSLFNILSVFVSWFDIVKIEKGIRVLHKASFIEVLKRSGYITAVSMEKT